MKKCIYCGTEISDDCVVDFCEKCGVEVFGRKMFDTIIRNMEEARASGNLCHDNVFTDSSKEFNKFGK